MHQAHRGAGDIDRNVPASDNNHALAELDLETKIDVDQKVDAVIDAGQMGAGNVEFAPLIESRGQQYGVEFLTQRLECNVAPNRHTRVERDTERQNVVDFHLDDFPRKPKLRNTEIEHSSWNGSRFEDLDGVTEQRQIVRAGQAANTGADNCHTLGAFLRRWQSLSLRIMAHAEIMAIGREALQRADG